jgi:peroxiredoxin
VSTSIADSHLRRALAKLETLDGKRRHLNFTLQDLDGKQWTLSDLQGKVVLLNFWATWCPPCRKEIPDLSTLQTQYADQGLIVLGVTDEPIEKVAPFASRLKMRYPVLLDPGRTVESAYGVGGDQGIPKSFVYDREGRIVAQSIDARSMRQLLDMLKTAGLHLLQSLPAR